MNRIVVSAAAGLAGGALGLVAMRYAMQGTKKVMDKLEGAASDGQSDTQTDTQREPETEQNQAAGAEIERGAHGHDDEYMSVTAFHAREGESATGALARGLYERATGRPFDEELEEAASKWVHRGYGEAMALAYALLASGRGWGVKGGLVYGTLLWLLGDEIMVPLLGLAKKPTAYGLEGHVPAFVAHLAYGAALGAVVDAAEAWTHEAAEHEAVAHEPLEPVAVEHEAAHPRA